MQLHNVWMNAQLHQCLHEVPRRQRWRLLSVKLARWLQRPIRQKKMTTESARDKVYKVQRQKRLLLQPQAHHPVENDLEEYEPFPSKLRCCTQWSNYGRSEDAEPRRREGRGAKGGGVWGWGVPLPNWERYGEGAVPPLPSKYFDFRPQNGEIWSILGAIFRGEIGRCCMWQWLEVRGLGRPPLYPTIFEKGAVKTSEGPGIHWLTCNSNSDCT